MTRIEVHIHHPANHCTAEDLAASASKALPHCLAHAAQSDSVLRSLEEIEISLVDDAALCGVHDEFLDDPTPTDVITFDHGEILLSVETAVRQSEEHGCTLQEELTRYIVHGLLHLAGHLDKEEDDRNRMIEAQEKIVGLLMNGGPI